MTEFDIVEFAVGMIWKKCWFVRLKRIPISPFGFKIFCDGNGPVVYITSVPPGFALKYFPDQTMGCVGVSVRDVGWWFDVVDITLFEGYIADPEFDLDKIVRNIRNRYLCWVLWKWSSVVLFCWVLLDFCGK
jgi:hypothetical protein